MATEKDPEQLAAIYRDNVTQITENPLYCLGLARAQIEGALLWAMAAEEAAKAEFEQATDKQSTSSKPSVGFIRNETGASSSTGRINPKQLLALQGSFMGSQSLIPALRSALGTLDVVGGELRRRVTALGEQGINLSAETKRLLAKYPSTTENVIRACVAEATGHGSPDSDYRRRLEWLLQQSVADEEDGSST